MTLGSQSIFDLTGTTTLVSETLPRMGAIDILVNPACHSAFERNLRGVGALIQQGVQCSAVALAPLEHAANPTGL